MTDENFKEQRVNLILRSHWEALRGDRSYPSEKDIDPQALGDIWDNVFLLHTNAANTRSGFRYGYMGPSLIQAYGDNISGQDIYDALLSTRRDTIVEDILKTLHTRAPVLQEAEFENVQHVRIKYRRILCPLGPDENTIDYIIGAMRWKAE